MQSWHQPLAPAAECHIRVAGFFYITSEDRLMPNRQHQYPSIISGKNELPCQDMQTERNQARASRLHQQAEMVLLDRKNSRWPGHPL